MVMMTLSGSLAIQGGGATPKPAAPASPQAPATTGRDAEGLDPRALRDQIREQVRSSIQAAAQGRAAADVQVHVQPVQGDRGVYTIQGPNGERTVIGTPPPGEMIPPQAVDISIAFFLMVAVIIIGLPLARAFARRMDRKAALPRFRAKSRINWFRSIRPWTRSRLRLSESPRASASRHGCSQSSATRRDRPFLPAHSVSPKYQVTGNGQRVRLARRRKSNRKPAPFSELALGSNLTSK
jgi:hypothetical protein